MMRKYKLINGQPTEIKIIYLPNGGIISNPNEEMLIVEGCKELIIQEQPIINPWESVNATYSENETQIIQSWEVVSSWHEPSCTIQIKLTHFDNAQMLKKYPIMANYGGVLPCFIENEFVYLYANYVNSEDRSKLTEFNAQINEN